VTAWIWFCISVVNFSYWGWKLGGYDGAMFAVSAGAMLSWALNDVRECIKAEGQ
jgi:hypothetical protein